MITWIGIGTRLGWGWGAVGAFLVHFGALSNPAENRRFLGNPTAAGTITHNRCKAHTAVGEGSIGDVV